MFFRTTCILFWLTSAAPGLLGQDQIPASVYQQAVARFQQGKFLEAEETLRAGLRDRSRDARALGLMGVILDAEKRYDEAERYYHQAVQLAPRSASLLNNLGNHYLARGDSERAHAQYLKVVVIEPNHPNANLHLAQMSVAAKRGETALRHLGRLPNEEQATPRVELLRAQALNLTGRRSEAESLLKRIEEQACGDPRAVFSIGMVYAGWKRYEDAEKAFTRALDADPTNVEVLYNLGLAAMQAGHLDRAQEVFGAALKQRPTDTGVINGLTRIKTERQAQSLAKLRAAISADPQNPRLTAQLAKLLLEAKRGDEALATFRHVRALTSDPNILADCGHALVNAEQYSLAREFLEIVIAADSSLSNARLDLAIALFHTAGPETALTEIDKTSGAARAGDYFLLRAQILDARGQFEGAVETLNQGFRAAPTRSDLYLQAAFFLIKHQRYREALDLLQQATKILPDVPEVTLTEAITLELLQRPEEALALLTRIQSRWPEWSQPYLVNGIMLEIRLRSAEAKPLLETALALGARDAVAYYYLASAITHAAPEDSGSAQKAIDEALRLNPDDAYIRSLAGKIAYARKDYPAALEHLNAAIRLWPDMVEARQTLSATYRALGEKEKSVAELREILRIKQQNRTADQTPPFPAQNLLFTVRPPS